MARLKRASSKGVRIDSAEARARLPPCKNNEPVWVAITPGTALGYYKGPRDSAWWVRQRVGNRYVKARIGTPDDHAKADGEVVLTHTQAVRLAVTMQLEDRKPDRPRHYADGLTLNAVVDAYLDEHLAGRGSETISRQLWARHGRESIGQKLVTALDAAALRNWHRAMTTTPPTIRGKVRADFDPSDPGQLRARKATANRTLTIVKAALNFAWRGEGSVRLPPDLPAYWLKVPAHRLGEDPPPRMLEADEIRRLLNAAPPDLRDLLSGALMTGARRGELLALCVRDYDPDNGAVRIHQTKTGKTLLQPLTPEGEALFDRLTAGRAPGDRIFTRADGSPWGRNDVTKPMAAAVEAAGLEGVSFKTTRATYGKLLLLATKDIELVAKALGHSDSRVTRKHYAQLLPSEVASAITRLPELGIDGRGQVARLDKKSRASG